MSIILTLFPLLLSVALLQLSSGGVGPLDALSGLHLGFSTAQVGMLGSSHFLGFFIGCWWAPRLMGRVGQSRAFAAFTALGAIGVLAHMMVPDPIAWSLFRVASGICIAGCYTVIESWIQSSVTNKTRGRAVGLYRLAEIAAQLAAQLMIGFLEPATYLSYNILALFCCASLLPLALTGQKPPALPAAPRLNPMLALRLSPLAAAGAIVAGLTSAAIRMVGPVFGQQVALATDQIALFLAAFILGGGLAQYPAGWIADRVDRRWVLIWFSIASIGACGVMLFSADGDARAIIGASALLGFTSVPIYSISTAHAHDFAAENQRVELSAALMFLYAVGAIASPLLASALIESLGPWAMFAMISVAHLGLVVFGLVRMRARPAPEERTKYVYSPRTSFTIGRLLSGSRKKK